jgi:hypothetical protein
MIGKTTPLRRTEQDFTGMIAADQIKDLRRQ